MIRLETLEPGTQFRVPGDDAIYTLERVNYTRAIVHSNKTTTRTFEVPDEKTGAMKRVTITRPVVKDVAPGMEVELL
jgi:hypothetical protein